MIKRILITYLCFQIKKNSTILKIWTMKSYKILRKWSAGVGQTIVEKYCLDRLPQFYSNFVIVDLSGVGILSFSEQIISTKYSIRSYRYYTLYSYLVFELNKLVDKQHK